MDRGLSHPHLYDLSDVARHVRLLTGCRQANASGRIGLPRASIRRRECPELAHMRQTTSASTGPVLGAYRTFGRPPATSQFDPQETFGAWSIRALNCVNASARGAKRTATKDKRPPKGGPLMPCGPGAQADVGLSTSRIA